GGADGGVHVHVRQRRSRDRDGELVEGEGADVDADRLTGDPARDARVVERLPGDFEDQPLLRVHRGRLARGDAEEVRVERPRVAGHEGRPAGVHAARGAFVGIVEAVHVPAGRRDIGDAVALADEELPERLRRIDAAGVPAADSDYGDVRHGELLAYSKTGPDRGEPEREWNG